MFLTPEIMIRKMLFLIILMIWVINRIFMVKRMIMDKKLQREQQKEERKAKIWLITKEFILMMNLDKNFRTLILELILNIKICVKDCIKFLWNDSQRKPKTMEMLSLLKIILRIFNQRKLSKWIYKWKKKNFWKV